MRADTVAGVLFIGLAVFLYSVNWQNAFPPMLGDPGSTLLPSAIAVLMGVLGTIQIVQSLLQARAQQKLAADRHSPSSPEAPARDRRLIIDGSATIVLLLLYVLVLPYLGFFVSTLLFFSGAAFSLGERTPGAACLYLVSALIVTSVVFYGLTLGLKVSLPSAVWSLE